MVKWFDVEDQPDNVVRLWDLHWTIEGNEETNNVNSSRTRNIP